MSGGYASLPTSHLPGSVPAVIDSDPKLLNSGDAPSGVGAGGEGNAQPSNGWKGVFSITSYRPYFNVDTCDVVERIVVSLYPHRGDFVDKIAHNPDMYGPIWISTTLVFLAAVLGNCASYLSFEPSTTDTEWVYDINYVSLAAAIFYAYICLVPVGFYFLNQFLGIPSSLVQIWCLYGYSLFIFIPASFLLLIPMEVFKWIVIALAGLESGFFVGHNMQSQIRAHSNNWTIQVFISFVLQLCLALVIKFCFFA